MVEQRQDGSVLSFPSLEQGTDINRNPGLLAWLWPTAEQYYAPRENNNIIRHDGEKEKGEKGEKAIDLLLIFSYLH
jgi:hypothetical protein